MHGNFKIWRRTFGPRPVSFCSWSYSWNVDFWHTFKILRLLKICRNFRLFLLHVLKKKLITQKTMDNCSSKDAAATMRSHFNNRIQDRLTSAMVELRQLEMMRQKHRKIIDETKCLFKAIEKSTVEMATVRNLLLFLCNVNESLINFSIINC